MRSLLKIAIKIFGIYILISIFAYPIAAEAIFDKDVDILRSDITGVTISYRIPDHAIVPDNIAGKQYHSIEIARTAHIRKEGQVEIPVKIVPLAVPPMAEVSIQILGEEYQRIPFRKLVPFFARHTPEEFEAAFSSELARSPKVPSSKPYVLSKDEVRGLNIVRLAITTARYSEISQELSILKNITVRVDFVGARENLSVGYRNPGVAFDRIFRNTVANYDVGRDWFLPRMAPPISAMATSSAFDSSDTWVRVELLSEGIYRFGWLEFNAAGIEPLSVDPSQVRMFYGGGRELPLSNFDQRPALFEIPIEIIGGDDGTFDNADYIIFYADAVDSWEYSEDLGLFQHYKNHYTNKNVYWLTIGGNFSGPPMRFAVADGSPGGLYDVSVDGFTAKYHKEEEWLFWRQTPNSGIYDYFEWYWAFGSDTTVTVQLFDVVSGEEAKIVVRHKSGTPYLTVNGSGPIAPSTNQDFSTYSTFNLSNGLNSFVLESSGDFYLDYIDVHYKRWLKLIDGNLLFAQPDTFGTIRYNLAEVTSPSYILLDISDRSRPVRISGGDLEGQNLVLHDTVSTGSHKQYYISTVQRLKSPGSVSFYELDNLRDISSVENRADEIIITHDGFYDQAATLAELREQEYDMPTRIVRISDIYNQFSFGLVDAVAIRDFLKYAYENWPEPAPTFALLLGDGHYDFRNYKGLNNPVFIPPFENDRQMTDDHFIYFGEKGHLDSDSSGAPDMMIGRIPANSVQDAEDMIGKIVDYDANPDLGSWRNRVVIAADDNITPRRLPNETFHTRQAETLSNLHVPSSFEVGKIYLIEYPMQNGEKPTAREALIGAFNRGSLIVDWIGHGSPGLWADEHIFRRSQDIPRLTNGKKLPLVFTASCSIGFFDDPGIESFGEELIRHRSRGAVAVISATRVVFASPNTAYNNTVFDQLLYEDSVGIGEAMYIAKYLRGGPNGTQSNDRFYVLFGDAVQILQFPKFDVRFISAPDSLVALSEDGVSGEIIDNQGNLMSDFNGTVWVTVKDGTITKSVILLDRYNNPLSPPNNTISFLAPGATIFIGPVDVVNGVFSTRFFIPKDVSYGSRGAKIYAYAENGAYDAVGVVDSILISGSVPSIQDSTGPEIRLLADSRPFSSGVTLVRSGFNLMAEIEDDHGINITGQLGHGIVIRVDDGEVYEADATGNFSYSRGGFQAGTLELGLPSLPLGEHTISLKAWDNFNNSTLIVKRIEVVSTEDLQITEVMNYPNPVRGSGQNTSFQYCLNNDVDRVIIKIFTESGRKIKTMDVSWPNEGARMGCHQIAWNLRDADGDPLSNGIYLYQVSADGRNVEGKKVSVSEAVKLVILR